MQSLQKSSTAENMSKIVRLLLESGADPDSPNTIQKTPRDLVPGPAETTGPLMQEMKDLREIFDEIQAKPRPRKVLKVPETPQCGNKQEKLTKELFSVYICFYYRKGIKPCPRPQRVSVYDLVYGDKLKDLEQEYIDYLKQELHGNIETISIWKWIHFPANNVSSPWCEMEFHHTDTLR